MKTVEEQMVVMQAFVDGKTIKRTSNSTGYFFVFKKGNSPKDFNWQDFDYDIVEEPIVRYGVIAEGSFTRCYYDENEALAALIGIKERGDKGEIIKLVQDMGFKGDEE